MDEIEVIGRAKGGALDLIESEDPTEQAFTVDSPVMVNNIPTYTVRGVDSDGPFECKRRFTEFATLREALASAWPGFYIPYLPDKSYKRPNDPSAIDERRQLLQRYMR